MNNAQLIASGVAPLPAGFNSMLKLYSNTWETYQLAEKAIKADARHADNFTARGSLTARGVRVIYKLFSHGLDDDVIADLMDIGESSVSRRRKEWNA